MNGPTHPAMLTDLYEFTMANVYFREKMTGSATFSLFIRKYPPHRGYFVSAGLEEVLTMLESFRFKAEDLDYLEQGGHLTSDFLHYLSTFRFTGDVFAIPEGRLFFKNEPILEVTAPIIEAQLVETLILNAVNLEVSIATKASRCVHAARGRKLVDFSLRRTHGIDAGLKVARASFIAGFDGTSNVLAGQRYGIPISGTMAHSFITSFPEEIDAFRAFARHFPDTCVLLIDSYDTLLGARKAAEVAAEMTRRGETLRGVRLDSGDMADLSRKVRRIFREEGQEDLYIFASGGFDEFKIARTIEAGGEIDGFGVGTKMGVSADAPYTDIAYKLVRYQNRPVLKLSTGKKTLVSDKQVFRETVNGRPAKDTVALRHERGRGEPLLQQMMAGGRRLRPAEPLPVIRDRFREEFQSLDEAYKRLRDPNEFPVHLSRELAELQEEVMETTREREIEQEDLRQSER